MSGSTWPEQEVVTAWLLKHGLDVPLEARLELQARLTALRLSQSARSAALKEAEQACELRIKKDESHGRLQARSIITRCILAIRALKGDEHERA